MADARVVAVMEDRPHLEGRLFLAEGALDMPQALVGPGHVARRQVGVGGENELSVQAGIASSTQTVEDESKRMRNLSSLV